MGIPPRWKAIIAITVTTIPAFAGLANILTYFGVTSSKLEPYVNPTGHPLAVGLVLLIGSFAFFGWVMYRIGSRQAAGDKHRLTERVGVLESRLEEKDELLRETNDENYGRPKIAEWDRLRGLFRNYNDNQFSVMIAEPEGAPRQYVVSIRGTVDTALRLEIEELFRSAGRVLQRARHDTSKQEPMGYWIDGIDALPASVTGLTGKGSDRTIRDPISRSIRLCLSEAGRASS